MKFKIFEMEYDFDENQDNFDDESAHDSIGIHIPGFMIDIVPFNYGGSIIRFYVGVDFSWINSYPEFQACDVQGIFSFEDPKDIIKIIPHIEKHSVIYLDRLKKELEGYKDIEPQIEKYKTIKDIIT